MIDRLVRANIEKSLSKSPCVALLGSRQVGKTTLALEMANSLEKESIYLDLERPSHLTALLSDPEYYLSQHLNKLVILDEIQRYPEIFPILRSLIDEQRRLGNKSCQYLITGSSSKTLLGKSSESLAGRVRYIDITGFNLLETGRASLNDLWIKGGFPESFLEKDYENSFEWRESMIRTYIEYEIKANGYNVPSDTMRRFWGMLSHNQGELFNGAKIADSLGVSTPTVFKYLGILEDLFMVRVLRPWYQNHGKRLVKSPKVYIKDSGILHGLLFLKNIKDVLNHPIAGSSWEGFVIENIASVLGSEAQLWFYRTSAGAEVDLIIESKGQKIGVEIKRSLSPVPSRGLYTAIEDMGLSKTYIVYPGTDSYTTKENIEVMPLFNLLESLRWG